MNFNEKSVTKDISKSYVSIEGRVFYGQDAEKLLKQCNDSKYLTQDGVVKVSKDRWKTSQLYEKHSWMTKGLNLKDDRNLEHQERFDDYRGLLNRKFEKVIELGCGPFTNMRLILPRIERPHKITLLDPLIKDYLGHPNCPYKDAELCGVPVDAIPSTIEEFVPPEQYDLVVLINVLEHCFDISRVFDVVVSCLKPSGILVLAENMFTRKDLKAFVNNKFDAGHPIRVAEDFVEDFVSKNFDSLYNEKFYGLYNQPYRIDLYFMGQKKASLPNPTLHFVYSGDPYDDKAIHAPQTKSNRLFRFLQQRVNVRYYDWADKTSPVDVKPNDVILGHPHPEKGTIIRRLFEKECAGKYLIWPFHTQIPEINRYAKDVAEIADKLLLVCGPYWTETIEQTEYSNWKNKIVRLDNAIDAKVFPLLKKIFNPVGNRGLFVFGRSGPEKGTTQLFKLLGKTTYPVVVAGGYSESDLQIIRSRPNTHILGPIGWRNPETTTFILNTCDFFVNMSVSDASPSTLLECMALGLIPITTPQCGYYYPSFFLLSLSQEEQNLQVLQKAQQTDHERLRILQAENRKIIEHNHNWEKFCETVWKHIKPIIRTNRGDEQTPELSERKDKRVRVAADYVKTGVKVDTESLFGARIRELFSAIRPRKIIETGTYLGSGTTTIIANALKELDINDAVFCSIEVNPECYAKAKNYFQENNIEVHALNGLSVSRSMLPSREEIARRAITDVEYDGIFVDHKEQDRVEEYYKETNFPNVPDNLLYKSLEVFDFKPDFVLLDSGGHMGNIEFNYLIDNLQGECHIALDDIYHVKHHRSFKQIQEDDRFELIVHSEEKFGFCIAKFTPQQEVVESEVKNILWVRTDSIGDNVLAASMLPHIREKFRDAKIAVLCQEHIAQLYETCRFVDDTIVFNRKRVLKDAPYRQEIIKRLETLKPDLVLNSVYSREQLTDVFSLNCGAKQSVALKGNCNNMPAEIKCKYDQFYTKLLPSTGEHKPELERHKDFLKGLDINVEALQPIVWITPEDEKFAEKFFRENNLNPDKTIALFAGAQHEVRLYEKYGEALSEFCKKNRLKVIALGAEEDCSINQRNLDDIGVETVNLSGKTTIRQSAAILKRCRLAVGAETGLAHISCAVGIPNVILLGGGYFGRFMPYSQLTSVTCLPLECFGCDWTCRYEKPHCIRDVAPEAIAEALRQSFASRSEKPRVFAQAALMWNPAAAGPKWKPFDRLLDTSKVEIVTVNKTNSYKKGNNILSAKTKLTVATSIAPDKIDRQIKAIDSWVKLGLDVVSINCREEIEILQGSFPDVKFIQAKRDAKDTFGKPFVYLDEFLKYFQNTGAEVCGIVNSDIHLFGDEDIVSFIRSQAKDSLVYGHRIEVDSLEDLRGQVCKTGFDFFFFDSSLISCFPKSDFCIGKPWWDYWLPTIAVLEGFSIKQLISPFAYHIKHLCEWDTEEWGALAKKFFGYLQKKIEVNFYSDPGNNPWALLGRMFSAHHHRYLKEKGIGDENKMSMEIIVPCILGFLEKKTLRITYANNTSAGSQSALRPSKEKREVAQQKEVIQQKETAQNVERQMDFEAQRNSQLTIATSIAPKNLKKQAKAIESWTKLGFDVVSLNCGEEINILQESFPDVKFVQAKRDARNTFGKPFIYFDEFLEYFQENDCEFCGIVNSDIFLIGDKGIISFIQSQARNALVYASRVEIDSLEVLRGEVYEDGFDFFFFHKSLISCFPKSDFCMGVPWWDYWALLIPALEGFQIKKFVTPFAYHIKHSFNWDNEQWIFLAEKCFEYLLGKINENSNANPDNNPWIHLGRMISEYHKRDLKENDRAYKDTIPGDVLCRCLLDFLGKKSVRVNYIGEESALLANRLESSEEQEDIFIHKAESKTQDPDCLYAEYDVSIVICTRDRAELLDQTLTSLKEAARGVVYELIVVEGGSRDNTLDVLRKHNVIKVYSESEWLGQGRHSWPQLYNFGFSMTNVKWAMYASDDIVFAKGCVSKAFRLLNKQRDEVAGGIFFYKNAYQTRPEWDKFGIDFTYGPRLLMNYGLVRLDHFREVGGLDEAYRFYFADSDLCCKLYEKGKQLIPLPESFVAHNNVLDAQKRAKADTSGYDIELFQERWKHLVPTEIPRPRRLLWQEEFFEAFNVPADLERIDSSIESFWHGLACFQEGLFEEAKSRFMQAVASFCDHEQVLWYLARAADKCGDKALAEKAATAVVKLSPDFEPALDFLVHLSRQGQRVAVPAVCSVRGGSVSTVNGYAVETGVGELREGGAVCSEVTENLRRANRGFAALKRTQNKTDRNRYEMNLRSPQDAFRRKIKKFNKVVIWGLKTQKHTHAYIYHHFFSTLEKLDASVVLVDDRAEDEGIIERGDLVISVDVSSSNLPIKEGVYYCLHNCSDDIHRKIEPSRSIRLQTYTNSAEQADQRWGLVTFFDSKTRTLFQPWATDLLGDEFEEPILEKSSNIVFWVGSIWNDGLGRGNINEMEILNDVLEERDIRFIHLHDISDSLHIKYIRHSLIAPAIAGRWQVENNYLACRMWKNISYGQLGVSNVQKFDDVFNGCTVKGGSIEEIIDNTLSLPFDRYRDMIYEQQEIVREHHTYVNRLLNIIKAFEFVESL